MSSGVRARNLMGSYLADCIGCLAMALTVVKSPLHSSRPDQTVENNTDSHERHMSAPKRMLRSVPASAWSLTPGVRPTTNVEC